MGSGIMVSAFTSYVFGFGMDMTKTNMEEVNKWRKKYLPMFTNTEATQFWFGNNKKSNLKNCPSADSLTMVRRMGTGVQPYGPPNRWHGWRHDCTISPLCQYEKMQVQICVWAWSLSGHAEERVGGLNSNSGMLGYSWEGEQQKMRNTFKAVESRKEAIFDLPGLWSATN